MDINEILIEQIKQNDCLFNLSHREYKNVHKKMEIWESVAQSSNLSADACRKRWKELRDAYKKRKRSELLASGNGAPNPVKRWKYMEMLTFLYNYTDSRPTVGNVESDIVYEDLVDCSMSTIVVEDESEDPPPRKVVTKKQVDTEVISAFKEAMKQCSETVQKLASIPCEQEKERDSTSLLFESLAKKISKANISQENLSIIECKVVALFYKELS
ncbi:PREDICTED: uncharacterized protein LOC108360246 [Rhagoletis zephyria]|uniref:uncharacterized protein LOC108360246 n=1 Tax=Rhagoletis zephyria TaxID=28612 RepID=UPI0008119407|nr:PREDICTED: uncharacterized protein LOC108360246 [Rhagoletis zephyria]